MARLILSTTASHSASEATSMRGKLATQVKSTDGMLLLGKSCSSPTRLPRESTLELQLVEDRYTSAPLPAQPRRAPCVAGYTDPMLEAHSSSTSSRREV